MVDNIQVENNFQIDKQIKVEGHVIILLVILRLLRDPARPRRLDDRRAPSRVATKLNRRFLFFFKVLVGLGEGSGGWNGRNGSKMSTKPSSVSSSVIWR